MCFLSSVIFFVLSLILCFHDLHETEIMMNLAIAAGDCLVVISRVM